LLQQKKSRGVRTLRGQLIAAADLSLIVPSTGAGFAPSFPGQLCGRHFLAAPGNASVRRPGSLI
jgi:hypothetical protein